MNVSLCLLALPHDCESTCYLTCRRPRHLDVILSFVALALGQRALKEYHCPRRADKETQVQSAALTSQRPHGERVRGGAGPQTLCSQPALRLHFPTWQCWLCFHCYLVLAPLGTLSTQAGVLLEPQETETPLERLGGSRAPKGNPRPFRPRAWHSSSPVIPRDAHGGRRPMTKRKDHGFNVFTASSPLCETAAEAVLP